MTIPSRLHLGEIVGQNDYIAGDDSGMTEAGASAGN